MDEAEGSVSSLEASNPPLPIPSLLCFCFSSKSMLCDHMDVLCQEEVVFIVWGIVIRDMSPRPFLSSKVWHGFSGVCCVVCGLRNATLRCREELRTKIPQR